MKRDTIDTYRQPFTIDEVLDELRMVIWCTASQVALLGKSEVAEAVAPSKKGFGFSEYPYVDVKLIDLETYEITRTTRLAYDFAFQVGQSARFGDCEYCDFRSLVYGSVRTSWSSEFAPSFREESHLRYVADMMTGRMNLVRGEALTIRQLSLLANMTEAAVRSALSAEGIKTEGRPASLPANVALAWLKGRRGFVPTRDGEALEDYASSDALLDIRDFPAALKKMVGHVHGGCKELAKEIQIDLKDLEDLVEGRKAEVTVPALVRLAKRLWAEPDQFVASYVRFLDES